MRLIYDHISAILVSTVVLMILAGIHLTSQTAGTDAGMYYMNRVQTLALIEMIERDFPNIGAGTNPAERNMIAGHAWAGEERYFEFRATVDTSAGAAVQRIRYVVAPADNPTCDQAAVACFEVRRMVDAGSGFQPAGSSNTFVTDFEIELFPQTGDLADVREVRVRLASLSPGGKGAVISSTSWESRYRPFNLSLLSF